MPYNSKNGDITCDICGVNASIPNEEKWQRLSDMPSMKNWAWSKEQDEFRCPQHPPDRNEEPWFWW